MAIPQEFLETFQSAFDAVGWKFVSYDAGQSYTLTKDLVVAPIPPPLPCPDWSVCVPVVERVELTVEERSIVKYGPIHTPSPSFSPSLKLKLKKIVNNVVIKEPVDSTWIKDFSTHVCKHWYKEDEQRTSRKFVVRKKETPPLIKQKLKHLSFSAKQRLDILMMRRRIFIIELLNFYLNDSDFNDDDKNLIRSFILECFGKSKLQENQFYKKWRSVIKIFVLNYFGFSEKLRKYYTLQHQAPSDFTMEVVKEVALAASVAYFSPLAAVLYLARKPILDGLSNFIPAMGNKITDSIVKSVEDTGVYTQQSFERNFGRIETTINTQLTDVTESFTAKIDEVGEKVKDVVGILEKESFISSIVKRSMSNPASLLTSLLKLFHSESLSDFIANTLIVSGLLGVESFVAKTIIQKLMAQPEQLHHQAPTNSSKLIYLAGFLATVFGYEIGVYKNSLLEYIPKAHVAAKQLTEVFETLEDLLHEMGIVTSARMSTIENLKERITLLIEEMTAYEQLYLTRPTSFISPLVYSKFDVMCNNLIELEKDCTTQKYKEFVNTNFLAEIIQMSGRLRKLRKEVNEVRDSVGIRPIPVGVLIMGESQIGKSHLQTDIIKRVIRLIQEDMNSDTFTDPQNMLSLFADIENWCIWDQNTRDEYDEGYHGQQIHSVDDIFTAADQEDHIAILNFISPKKLPTKQAELHCKGRPYEARIFIASANKPPVNSVTINNLDALYNRFHILVHANKNSAPADAYDENFSHLDFHIGEGSDFYKHRVSGTGQLLTPCNECGAKDENRGMDDIAFKIKSVLYRHAILHMDRVNKLHSSYTHQAPRHANSTVLLDDRFNLDVLSKITHEDRVFDWYPFVSKCYQERKIVFTMNDLYKGLPSLLRHSIITFDNLPDNDHGQMSIQVFTTKYQDLINVPLYILKHINRLRSPVQRMSDNLLDELNKCEFILFDEEKSQFVFYKDMIIHEVDVCNFNGSVIDSNYLAYYFMDRGVLFGDFVPQGTPPTNLPYPEEQNSTSGQFGNYFNGGAKTWQSFFSSHPNNPYNRRGEFKDWFGFEAELYTAAFKHIFDFSSYTESFDFNRFGIRAEEIENCFLRTLFKGSVLYLELFNRIVSSFVQITRFMTVCVTEPLVRALLFLTSSLGIDISSFLDGVQALTACLAGSTLGVWSSLAVTGMIVIYFFKMLNFFKDKAVSTIIGDKEQQSENNSKIGSRPAKKRYILKKKQNSGSVFVKRRDEPIKFVEMIRSQQSCLSTFPGDNMPCKLQIVETDKIKSVVHSKTELAKIRREYPDKNVDFKSHFIKQDIFDSRYCPNLPRVHCVAADYGMSKGIAGYITRQDPSVRESLKELCGEPQIGTVLSVPCTIKGFSFDLISIVTKLRSDGKPTLKDYEQCLVNLREFMEDEKVLEVVMPLIGMGLDKIPLDVAFRIIYKVFNGSNLGLYMCYKNFTKEWNFERSPLIEVCDNLDTFYYVDKSVSIDDWMKSPMVFYNSSTALDVEVKDLITDRCFVRTVKSPTLNGFVDFLMDVVNWVIENRHPHIYIPEICFNNSWFCGDYAWWLLFILSDNLFFSNLGILDSETYTREICVEALIRHNLLVPLDKSSSVSKSDIEQEVLRMQGNLRPELMLQVKSDPNALMLLSSMKKNCLVGVAPLLVAAEAAVVGNSLLGWGFQNYVIFPAHLINRKVFEKHGKSWVVVSTLDHNSVSPLKSQLRRTLAKVLTINVDRDLALAELADTKSIKSISAKITDEFKTQIPFETFQNFSNLLLNHIPTFDQISKIPSSVPVIHYLPNSGLSYLANASFREKERMLVDGNNIVRTGFEVIGVSVAGSPTTAGDCGGPIIMYNTAMSNKLLGMHVIGGPNYAFSILVCREYIDELLGSINVKPQGLVYQRPYNILQDFRVCCLDTESDFNNFFDLVDFSNDTPVDMPHGNVVVLGSTKYTSHPAPWNGGSVFKKTPFFGAFPELEQPAVLRNDDKRMDDRSNLLLDNMNRPSILVTQTSKFGAHDYSNIDFDLLDYMVRTQIEYDTMLFKQDDWNIGTVSDGVLAEDEMLNGNSMIQFHEKLETRSSIGVPFNLIPGLKHKRDVFNISDSGNISWRDDKNAKDLRAIFYNKLLQAQKGKVTFSLWKDCLKDELRPIEAVKIGKTRTFSSPAIDIVLLTRFLFGRYKAYYTQLGIAKSHAIGVNPISSDWSKIAHHIGVFPSVGDADFGNFDRAIPPAFYKAAYLIIIKTIEAVCPNDRWTDARYACAYESLYSFMSSGDCVYRTLRGNKSGNPLTTVLNCIVNSLYHWYTFIQLTGERDLQVYMDNVKIVFYGDDVLYSVSNLYKDVFNFQNISKIMCEHLDQKYTPANKYGDGNFVHDLDQVTFLKRSFYQLPGGIFLSPLKRSSIERCFNYSQVEAHETENWITLIDESMLESCMHGENYFNYFRNVLKDKCSSPQSGVPYELRSKAAMLLVRSYEVQYSLLMKRLG